MPLGITFLLMLTKGRFLGDLIKNVTNKKLLSENSELHSIEVCIIDIYVKEKKL